MDTHFRTCPNCKFEWETRDDFLSDDSVSLIGYQANFESLLAGYFLFNHSCKETISLEVDLFADLYDGPIYSRNLRGSEECPGYCLKEESLEPCPLACECAFVREMMQLLKSR
jgi:hypothetical protein